MVYFTFLLFLFFFELLHIILQFFSAFFCGGRILNPLFQILNILFQFFQFVDFLVSL